MRTMTALMLGLLWVPTLMAEEAKVKGIQVGQPKQLFTGFAFTEGPAKDTDGNVYFTDIPNAKIHRIDTQGKLSVFRENSRHANGLMYNPPTKELFACEMDGQVTALSIDGQQRRVLAGKYMGNRFNACNDLVIDQQGGVYFTDPGFRAPDPLPQGKLAVYYRSAEGEVTRLIDDLPNPNGVILSPDEKTLYVIPSGQAEMMAYQVKGPGKIGPGKVFCTLRQPAGQENTGGDGLTVDTKGNLYITSALGLQVYNPQGDFLGTIALPQRPANVTFAGEKDNILYVTARTSLYTVETNATGHQFPGASK